MSSDSTPKDQSLDTPKVTSYDPGAHELAESSESDDNFADARSVQDSSSLVSPISVTNPRPSAQPDSQSNQDKTDKLSTKEPASRPSTPGGQPIPTTIVERVDDVPAYDETPGTNAHELRKADAVPDMVIRHSRSPSAASLASPARSRAGSTPGDLPIPTTRVEKVDDKPSHGEVPGTLAYEKREEDAEPDEVEVVGDVPVLPTLINSSTKLDTTESLSQAEYDENEDGEEDLDNIVKETANEDGDEDDFGDDFDDFEEGDDADDGDFGDFDDGFQAAEVNIEITPQVPSAPIYPLLDFNQIETYDDILQASESHMEALFPPDTIDISALPATTQKDSVFLTDRSASLWSQLVAPPPLQPPNWIRSRIRRLFLVSLGVPVDLDEILPASKQKKLILPSMLISDSDTPRSSTDLRTLNRLKNSTADSTTSVDSAGKPKDPTSSKSKSRRGPPPAAELDIVSARQLCSITDEKLNGLDEAELKDHVEQLKTMEILAKEVLEYWTKRTDEKLGDREAFESVIENLVKHARKVRK